MMAWMSIMGNSAIDMVMNNTGVLDFGQQAMANPGSSIYLFLQSFPWTGVTTMVVTVLAIVFFITSADSGSLVLSNMTSLLREPASDAPSWMRILWAAIIGVLTVALLMAGGLTVLQGTVVIMGLPFACVLFLMMLGLLKALKVEGLKEDSHRASLSGMLSARMSHSEGGVGNWHQRLTRAVSFPSHQQVTRFLMEVGKPAMQEIRAVLAGKGFPVDVVVGVGEDEHLALTVDLGGEQNFIYQIWPLKCVMPAFTIRATRADSHYYRVEVHIGDGGQGYDLAGYNKEQVIADILDQYERHMFVLHAQREGAGGEGSEPTPS
jgi:choline/glycine/proline betaine transport protein